jgi:hypothetical protein
MDTNVMIAGTEHLSRDQVATLKNAFAKFGAKTFEFPTNSGGARFNWGDFVSRLKSCTHMILVLANSGDKSQLVVHAQAGVLSRKVALLCFNSAALERHMWLIQERQIDLVVVNSPHLHSQVKGGSLSICIEDPGNERDARSVAKGFIGDKNRKRPLMEIV